MGAAAALVCSGSFSRAVRPATSTARLTATSAAARRAAAPGAPPTSSKTILSSRASRLDFSWTEVDSQEKKEKQEKKAFSLMSRICGHADLIFLSHNSLLLLGAAKIL